MKSFVMLTCPVSGKKSKQPLDVEEEGVFAPYDGDDAPDLPLGWGRLYVDVVVPNPEVAAVESQRAAEREEAERGITAFLASEDAPEEQKASVRADVTSGKAKAEVEKQLEQHLPLPEEKTVVVRLSFPVLSDEAVTAALAALRAAGFPISVPA